MKSRQLLLVLGDVVLLYVSLYIALEVRYAGMIKPGLLHLNMVTFSFIFALWIISFYIVNFYTLNSLTNFFQLARTFAATLAIDILIAISYFYANPSVLITPKTVLVITSGIFVLLFMSWRYAISSFWKSKSRIPIAIIGDAESSSIREVRDYLNKHPHMGYELSTVIDPHDALSLGQLSHQLIIVAHESFNSQEVAELLYSQLSKKITIMDLADFCELVMGRIPLKAIDQMWFLRSLREGNRRIFDVTKRVGDFIGAITLGVLLLPFGCLIALLIKLTSKGPMFYYQTRVGAHGELFTMTKFRTMIANAEKGKAVWATAHDPRITSVGRLIRKLRFDEIPQLWNIITGEMSFVGPRPERPEFVDQLKKTIPFYEERLLLKPGLSGWAQVNYPYAASIDDAIKKLEYDLYYLKNRSPLLDLSIVLKTISIVARGAGQ